MKAKRRWNTHSCRLATRYHTYHSDFCHQQLDFLSSVFRFLLISFLISFWKQSFLLRISLDFLSLFSFSSCDSQPHPHCVHLLLVASWGLSLSFWNKHINSPISLVQSHVVCSTHPDAFTFFIYINTVTSFTPLLMVSKEWRTRKLLSLVYMQCDRRHDAALLSKSWSGESTLYAQRDVLVTEPQQFGPNSRFYMWRQWNVSWSDIMLILTLGYLQPLCFDTTFCCLVKQTSFVHPL